MGEQSRPVRLLSNANRNLARHRIWTWTLPALAARLPDGRTVRTCEGAGACARLCFARVGSYQFPAVKARHIRNLQYIVDDLDGWELAMSRELSHQRFRGAAVRVHDSGDFFSDEYLCAWLRVMAATPGTRFYAYTKELPRFRRLVEPKAPSNFAWVYSLGGIHDAALRAGDRVADVFPEESDIAAARYNSQAECDLLAVDGPAPVGMSANALPHLKRLQGRRTFGQLQAAQDGRDFRPDTFHTTDYASTNR